MRIEKIKHYFFGKGIFTGITATLLAVGTDVNLGQDLTFRTWHLIVFFSTLLLYNATEILQESKRFKGIKPGSLYQVIGMFSIFLLLALMFLIPIKAIPVLLLAALLSFAYIFPVYPFRKPVQSLRNLPYLKVIIIACVWMIVTVWLPLMTSENSISPIKIMQLSWDRFLLILITALPFDIRDMETDRKSGIKTLPVRMGSKQTWYLIHVLLLLWLLNAGAGYIWFQQSSLVWVRMFTGGYALIILNAQKLRQSQYYCTAWIDSILFVLGILMLMTSGLEF